MGPRLVTHGALRGLLYREAVRRRSGYLPYSPFAIYLDPSSICNVRCTFCPQSRPEPPGRHLMAWDLFERALRQIAPLRPSRLLLFAFGEATLNPRLPEMVARSVEAGLCIRLYTNALALADEKARALIEAGLQECYFSFDTADRQRYNRTRIGSDFDRVLANIRGMVALRDRLGRRQPRFTLQELVPPSRPGGAAVNSAAYRSLFAGLRVRLKAKALHSFAGQGTAAPAPGPEGPAHCSQLYRRLVVAADGKVHACCLDPYGHNVVGDLGRGDRLADVWNGPGMAALRDRTSRGDVQGLRPCQDCELLARGGRARRSWAKAAAGLILWRLAMALCGPRGRIDAPARPR
jgi:hypothetical protein